MSRDTLTSIGAMRDRITIQQETTVTDAQGGRETTWSALVTDLSAEVRSLTTQERVQAGALGSTVTYVVRIRYRGDVLEAGAHMQLLWTPYQMTTAKTLQVHGVQPLDGKRAYLLLECSEVV